MRVSASWRAQKPITMKATTRLLSLTCEVFPGLPTGIRNGRGMLAVRKVADRPGLTVGLDQLLGL